ncbi:zinc-ribbon domain-containing protein [Lactobacillus sp. PV037]|uniref:zinc ribbon domain-containing protein n=1 Tax=unclassified Lactobacillus TaxID=2620435 RepID=UPI00223EE750|nr:MULTISPECIES: zinc ribbon domain-containing protein [unclassified Lactobacillus]QNQ82196.1 zinc-ribbon domain-containing protein [Lactobacillus sp. PV012]QNQ83696.1 zinc-ribbon domain-containing protein [Lactobacillus sp. PV037]
MKKFCPNCGKPVNPTDKVCGNCGHRLSDQKEPVEKVSKSTQLPQETEHSTQSSALDSKQQSSMKCPNCGKSVSPTDKVCGNCGYHLSEPSRVKKAPQQSKKSVSNFESKPQIQKRTQSVPRRPMKTKNKILLGLGIGVVIILGGGYYAGSQYFSQSNQVDRIFAAVKNPNANLSKDVISDDNTTKVTAASLKPFQNYYHENQKEADDLAESMKNNTNTSQVQLVKNGSNFLIFPKYVLKLRTYKPEISTNHDNSIVKINGKTIGNLTEDGASYTTTSPSLFPGKYNLEVQSDVSGRTLKTSSSVDVWNNKDINLDIKTQTFKIKGTPNADVYINDQKIGTLDNDGEATCEDYPMTKNMNLYLTTTYNKKTIKSEVITDLEGEIDSISDEENGTSNSGTVTMEDGSCIVEPQWDGVISKDDAEKLLDNAWSSPDSDEFIDGEDNKDYNDIKKVLKDIDKNEEINSADKEIVVESVSPAGKNMSAIIFKINWTFHKDDHDKDQTMEYKGGLIEKDGDDYKIKTIGIGKLTKDKRVDTDDDDD